MLETALCARLVVRLLLYPIVTVRFYFSFLYLRRIVEISARGKIFSLMTELIAPFLYGLFGNDSNHN